jgi:fumarate reductase subunit D
MIEALIRFLVVWFVIYPLVTLIHELTHGLMALILTRERQISCMLGTNPEQARITLNLTPRFRILLNFGTGLFGRCKIEGSELIRRRSAVLISLSAPLVSLALGILFFLLPAPDNDYLNQARLLVVTCAILQFLFTIVPVRYPQWFGGYRGMPSDGYRALRAWRGADQIRP